MSRGEPMDSRLRVQAAWAAKAHDSEERRPFSRFLRWWQGLRPSIVALQRDDAAGLPAVSRPNYDYKDYVQLTDLDAAGAFWGAVRVADRGDLR